MWCFDNFFFFLVCYLANVDLKPLLSNQLPYQNQHLLVHNDVHNSHDSRFHYRVHRTNLLSLMICDNRHTRSNVYANDDFCLSSFRLHILDIHNVGNQILVVLFDHQKHDHQDYKWIKWIIFCV